MLIRCRACGDQVPDTSTIDIGRDDLGDIISICADCADTHRHRSTGLGDTQPPHPRMDPRL